MMTKRYLSPFPCVYMHHDLRQEQYTGEYRSPDFRGRHFTAPDPKVNQITY